jgi:hypothetical protein
LKKNLLIKTGPYLGEQGNLGPHIELDFSPYEGQVFHRFDSLENPGHDPELKPSLAS